MTEATFLGHPDSLRTAFEELCNWAERITICTPRIDASNQSVAWSAIVRNVAKVRLCLVSDRAPNLLDLSRLHACGALRLISSHGRRFHACVYVFYKGDEVRALIGSARLTDDGLGTGIEGVVRLQGTINEAFVWSLTDFIESCLSRARVPKPGDISPLPPSDDTAAPRDMSDSPRNFELLTDVGVEKLHLVDEAETILEFHQRLCGALKHSCLTRTVRIDRKRVQAFWHPEYDLWAAPLESKERFWIVFGKQDPNKSKKPRIFLAISVSKPGAGLQTSAAFATNRESRRKFLVFRGGFGIDGREGRRYFWKTFRQRGLDIETDEGPTRFALLADLDSSTILEHLAGFVQELERLRVLGRRPAENGDGGLLPERDGQISFLELTDEHDRARMVWLWLLGYGTLTKDDAVRFAARGMRDGGTLDYQRLRSNGPLYEAILSAVERGVKLALFDRPVRGHVRAILEEAEDYPDWLWECCVEASLGDRQLTREETIRNAAAWAVENVGLRHQRLRAGGRVEISLKRAISRCIRRATVLKEGRDFIRRADS